MRIGGDTAVFLGGAIGTAARYGLDVALPHTDTAWPVSTTLANLAGAALLGMLTGWLSAPRSAGHAQARRFFGIGVLGAFTTYSSLAGQTVTLMRADRFALAGAYAGTTVAAGLVCAAAGLALGGLWRLRAIERAGPAGGPDSADAVDPPDTDPGRAR